jgi:hypothetical protein
VSFFFQAVNQPNQFLPYVLGIMTLGGVDQRIHQKSGILYAKLLKPTGKNPHLNHFLRKK